VKGGGGIREDPGRLAARLHKAFALAIWIGGERAVYERFEPVLRARRGFHSA